MTGLISTGPSSIGTAGSPRHRTGGAVKRRGAGAGGQFLDRHLLQVNSASRGRGRLAAGITTQCQGAAVPFHQRFLMVAAL